VAEAGRSGGTRDERGGRGGHGERRREGWERRGSTTSCLGVIAAR
jgi:hypothetical protein